MDTRRAAVPDRRDREIERLKLRLAEARAREREIRAEERERFSTLTAASKRFASSMRVRMDERQRQQRRLDAQYAVSRVLEESRDLAEAAPEVFRALATRLEWDAGALWTVESGALVCRGTWRSDGTSRGGFGEACVGHRFPRGAGLPGRVWQREEPCWIEDVLEDEGYARGEAAAEGLRCALAFPIQNSGRLVGVFELLKRRPTPPDDDTLATAYLLGHQIGQFVERRQAEAERDRALLREREARKQASGVLESITDAFFAVDRGWRLTYVNRRAEEFWGRPRVDLIGKSMWEEFPQATGSGAHRELRRAMDERETVGFEALSPVTGLWIASRAYPSADGLSVYFRDVTESKNAREAIRKSEERYRTLTANVPGAVFRADLADGRPVMRFVSDHIREITGYPARDFVDDRVRNYGEVVHPEDRPNNERKVWRALEARGHYNIEYRIVRADGEVRWMNERGSGVYDEDRVLLSVDGAIFDVTGRKRAEESRSYLATLVESTSDAVVGLDRDFNIVSWNRGARNITGYSSGEAVGRPMLDLVPAEHRESAGANAERLRDGGEVHDLEARLVTKGGEAVYVSLSISPVPVGADGPGFVWMMQDITDRKRRERDRAMLAEITDELAELDNIALTMARLGEKIGRYFGAEHCLFAELTEDLEAAVVVHGWNDEGSPSIAGTYRMRDFLSDEQFEASVAGEVLVVGDTRTDPRVNAESYGALGIRSFVIVPLVRDGLWRFLLAIVDDKPREWRDDEVSLIREITASMWTRLERARAGEALRASEERLRLAQAAARAGTWEWDLESGEIRWSDEHRKLFGFEPSDAPVRREEWWAAVHPEDLPRIEEASRRCSEEGQEWPEIEYRIFRGGETRWIDARGQTEKDGDGRAVRIRGISVNATDRKEAEAERDRLLAQEWIASAEAAERERISRELHDRVAHSMGVAHQSLQLYGVLEKKDAEKAAEKLKLATEMTKASLESTRNLSAELRQLDAEEGLEGELGHLLEVALPPRIKADLRVEGDEGAVPGHVRGQLFLILREAVRNAVAHAECEAVTVGLEVGPEKVTGWVEDDGRGFDTANGRAGVGLRSMRERAALLDGSLELSCRPDRGTLVEVSVPLGVGR